MSSETILNNRYKLEAQQGSGGMAVIYRAKDMVLGRTVAVKILRPSLTNDPAFLARFRNEARSVANLQHPNIVTVHDVGSEGTTHYIVMEFIEGQDLKRIIKASAALPVDRALNLAIQICNGIGFAHRAGLVHADVKPQNILVARDDMVKVTDFGIAQALTADTGPGERQQVVWGSPHYFAPEQARGEKPTAAADVYSIGIVMFEMLTGRLPYMGANQQELALAHIRDRVPLISEFNAAVPDNLVQIVYKVMSKEPAARYRMADQLGRILETYRDRGRQYTVPNMAPVNTAPPNPPPPARYPAAPTVANLPPVPPSTTPPPAQVGATSYQPSTPPVTPLPHGVEPLPTQRMDLAPVAPRQPNYERPTSPPAVPPAVPGAFVGAPQNPPYAQGGGQPPMQSMGQPPYVPAQGAYPPGLTPYEPQLERSGPYQQYTQNGEVPATLDLVTIALAVLAFFAVACLVPLYIVVIQAWT